MNYFERSMPLTFTRDVVAPRAVFCTLVYAVTVGQVVAEFTRHFTRVVVDLRVPCTRDIVDLTVGLCDQWTFDH